MNLARLTSCLREEWDRTFHPLIIDDKTSISLGRFHTDFGELTIGPILFRKEESSEWLSLNSF